MFKKLKEFFFGPTAEEIAPVAPYKVETPAVILPSVETPLPLVLPVPAAVVILPPTTEPAKAKRGRKPKGDATVKEKAATPIKKPAAISAVKKTKKV